MNRHPFSLLFGKEDLLLLRPEWRETMLLLAGILFLQGKAKVDGLFEAIIDHLPPAEASSARRSGINLIAAMAQELDVFGYQVPDPLQELRMSNETGKTQKKDHRFGGPWTLIKLDVLRQYLSAYTTALKKQAFELVYIDAFAGSGDFSPGSGESQQVGSVRIALDTPGFHRYCFIEQNSRRYRELEAIKQQHPEKQIELFRGDANQVLPDLLRTLSPKNWRGVVFLDPYGLNLDWTTLESIASSQLLDVWYLFSLSGLYRQAAKRMANVDEHKAAALDRCLGTEKWREAFYRKSRQLTLFDDPDIERFAEVDAMEQFVLSRLKETFPAVMKPLRLPREGAPLYSLFFAMSNPNRPAIGLAQRIAKHILEQA
ncbi:MAG: three-Cys-motif partner protein TcmP [Thiohalocapsa sp. PB-PSB1]|jgi:three-Cys-motif partner protein|nr:MAG: three-Cys-motif partner protein TcmP [Thiohalocapsa sp. PB-PSB1]HCS91297.1 hypothetical protein [Chromatiaceae bacterium]